MSVPDSATMEALGVLREFRQGVYDCLSRRADALFELADAVACRPEPVCSLPGLSLEPEFGRGHGALYDAVAAGWLDVDRVRRLLTETALAGAGAPTRPDTPVRGDDGVGGGRVVWCAGDVTGWPRAQAATSPERMALHDKSARTRGGHPVTAGWPFAVMAVLEAGATSWTAPVEVTRIGPDDTLTQITRDGVERVLGVLGEQNQRRGRGERARVAGFVFDAGYNLSALSWLFADRAHIVGRLRSNQKFHARPEPSPPGRGAPRRHGAAITLNKPDTLGSPSRAVTVRTQRYGRVRLSAWDNHHRSLYRAGFWAGHEGRLPIVEGTVVRVQMQRLPGGGVPEGPMWLWHAGPAQLALETIYAVYQRRFDLEHTFRFVKQDLGWTVPAPRRPAAAELWSWLVLAVYTQLRLARAVCVDARLPWERPLDPGVVTPRRVRRDFRRVRGMVGTPANPPKTSVAGPGRPRGSTRPPRQRHPTCLKHALASAGTGKTKRSNAKGKTKGKQGKRKPGTPKPRG